MRVVCFFALLTTVEAALNVVEQDLGFCLTAIGTREEAFSLVTTQKCNQSLETQMWSYDAVGTMNLCSISVGACLTYINRAGTWPVALVGLATSGGPASLDKIPFEYNPSTLALSVKGNCSLVLDSDYERGAMGTWPTKIYGPSDEHDCNNPGVDQRWKFVTV